MKNLIYIFCLSTFLINCSRNNDNISDDHTALESIMYIYLKDASGRDLIGTSDYSDATIKVSYVEPSSQSYNKNYEIVTDLDGNKFIKLYLNYGAKSSSSANTIVKWNENEQDTFRAEFSKGDNSIIVEKVYLGDDLICPDRDHVKVTLKK